MELSGSEKTGWTVNRTKQYGLEGDLARPGCFASGVDTVGSKRWREGKTDWSTFPITALQVVYSTRE